MTTRELIIIGPTSSDGLADLARDLEVPLDQIVSCLQRIALQSPSARDPGCGAPDLLWRARHLAEELSRVVAALSSAPSQALDQRVPDTTLLVRHAIALAADQCAESLGARRVVVRCSPQLAITTHPGQLHELLITTIHEAARRRSAPFDVRLTAQRVGNRLVVEVDGGVVPGNGIERLHHLTRAIGGRIEVVSGSQTRSILRIHIPQQRACDPTDLPDDVA